MRLLCQHLREAWEVHDGPLTNRAVWALAVYWYGVWAKGLRFKPLRTLFGAVYLVLKLFSEIVTGITMDRTVKLGRKPHIIHAATIFIHPRVVIGDNFGVMHNVTLGTNMSSDVPVVGNDVFIGCGASVLGKVHVGDGARIAANSLVINDVPAGSFAVGVPAKCIKIRSVKERRDTADSPAAGG